MNLTEASPSTSPFDRVNERNWIFSSPNTLSFERHFLASSVKREDASAHWVQVESLCAERKIPDVPKATSLDWMQTLTEATRAGYEVSSGALPCWRSVTVGDTSTGA